MNRLSQLHRRFCRSGSQPFPHRLLVLVLIPFSWLYGGLIHLRNAAYDYGWLQGYRSGLPVISVGNLTVGGTGKTPVVDWLVRRFWQQGKKPAIVSRGYGGSYAAAVAVVSDGRQIQMTADQCGDEPLLLAKRNPQTAVVVARKRADGVRWIEQNAEVDLILLDDSFQHRAVARDLDLVLLDATDPFGNGRVLPAGNLREGVYALQRADILLLTRSDSQIKTPRPDIPSFYSRHRLATIVSDLDGQLADLAQLVELRVMAFAGIADPTGFFKALRDCGFKLEKTVCLPDHAEYTSSVIVSLNQAAEHCDLLLTTEKDCVKLTADMFDLPCYAVGLELDITDGDQLMHMISQILWRKI